MVEVCSTLKESYTFVLKNTDSSKHIPVKIIARNYPTEQEINALNALTLDDAKRFARVKGWILIVLREEK